MKRNTILLLCSITAILGGCTSTNNNPPTTNQATEITTPVSTTQLSETTSASSTKQPTIVVNSNSTLPPAETSSPKSTEPSSNTPSLQSDEKESILEISTTSSIPFDDTIYIGEYLDSDVMEPNLEIAKNDNGSYTVQIGIYRLASIYDGIGELTADGMSFTATDPAGNPISGIITIEEQTAIVTFTQSTWTHISNDSAFRYTKSSAIPNIWTNDTGMEETEASTNELSIPSSYIGTWQLDGQKTSQCLKEGWSLQAMFGTGIQHGSSMEINEDGSFSYYIGIGHGGTGQLTAKEDGFSVTITPYESHSDVLEVLHLRTETDSNILYFIMDNYMEENDLYWIKQ